MATIFVWYPSFRKPAGDFPKSADEVRRKALSSIENVGHAAMRLDDDTYISWWPNVTVDESFRSPSFSAQTYDNDVSAEGGVPGLNQKISALEEGVIRSWWVRVAKTGFAIPYTIRNNPKTPNFDLRATNCSNIVALALRLGGADRILRLPEFGMMTPIHIAAWARAAGARQAIRRATGF